MKTTNPKPHDEDDEFAPPALVSFVLMGSAVICFFAALLSYYLAP